MDPAVQHHGVVSRQRYDRADREHGLPAPGEEAQSDVTAQLLPTGVWAAQQRGVHDGPEELCAELCRLLPRVLLHAAQGQVLVTAVLSRQCGPQLSPQGPYGALNFLKSLEFDWTKFKALKSLNFTK